MSHDHNGWTDTDNPNRIEVRYINENTDFSPNQAKALVEEHEPDREKLLKGLVR